MAWLVSGLFSVGTGFAICVFDAVFHSDPPAGWMVQMSAGLSGHFGVDMIDDWDDVDVFGWVNPKGVGYCLTLQQKLAPNCLPFYRWVDKRTGGVGHATSDWQKAMDDGREYLKRQETR